MTSSQKLTHIIKEHPSSKTTLMLQIVSKRQKKAQEGLERDGWVLVDVTSSSPDETFKKFSPFYPHGNIPVPGLPGSTSESVEGIWQGLKAFEKEGVDKSKFSIKNMKNIKRATGEKRGRVRGHLLGDQLIDYVTARKTIYIPSYQHVLKHHLVSELILLKGLLAEGNKVALIDFDVNPNVEDTSKPLSHASIIKTALLNN